MKALRDILYKVPIQEISGDMSVDVENFYFDSRDIRGNALFIAVRGTTTDGHDFINNAISKGAIAVVCEIIPEGAQKEITWIKVKDASLSLSYIAANFYGNPAEKLKIIGVTGTNGKTTTATVLHELFTSLGHKSGLLSTIVKKMGNTEVSATHTTSDAKRLQFSFREMVDSGCEYCFMEVSSHALVQNRVAGVPFALAIFTNITHDHLDYHKTFQEYIRAKKLLFDGLSENAFALVNADDRNASVMLQNTKAHQKTFALKHNADFKAKVFENTFSGLYMEVDGKDAYFPMIGLFNAYNLLGIYAAAVLLGEDSSKVLQELSYIQSVHGRFQPISSPDAKVTAIIDYAHTPDALKNVLETIADINDHRGKVLTVVGCGGNRDKTKRPLMAKIATELSDVVILTSDNPRDENPAEILTEMMTGVSITQRKKVLTIENRREAIAAACKMAAEHDIILVAGKGHENYQEIKGERLPFDDRLVLIETFKTLNI